MINLATLTLYMSEQTSHVFQQAMVPSPDQVVKIQEMYETVHPVVSLVVLFECTKAECRKLRSFRKHHFVLEERVSAMMEQLYECNFKELVSKMQQCGLFHQIRYSEFSTCFGGRKIYCFLPGAIIRHRDHKHAPFLVLGLSLLII